MAFFLYASFPNSRGRTRQPTTQAITYQTNIASQNDVVPLLTKIASANLNRTYLLVENLDPTFNTYYLYAEDIVVNPTVVATFGVLNQLRFDPIGLILYVKTVADGTDTNWAVVPDTNYIDVCELIAAGATAGLESLESVYAIGDQAAAATLLLGLDEGRN